MRCDVAVENSGEIRNERMRVDSLGVTCCWDPQLGHDIIRKSNVIADIIEPCSRAYGRRLGDDDGRALNDVMRACCQGAVGE